MFDDIYHIVHYSADTSRHYLPVDIIKQVIESMSYAKLVRHVTCQFLSCLHFTIGTLNILSDYFVLFNKPAYNSEIFICIQ